MLFLKAVITTNQAHENLFAALSLAMSTQNKSQDLLTSLSDCENRFNAKSIKSRRHINTTRDKISWFLYKESRLFNIPYIKKRNLGLPIRNQSICIS